MNRHLGTFLTTAALLAIPLSTFHASAQTYLQLDLLGPLLICETDKNLEIWVPDVHANHYAPGFRAASSEYPLTHGQYKQYEMRLKRRDGTDISGNMVIQPANLASGRKIAVYGEQDAAGCRVKSNLASLSLVVPKPDTIWPQAPADEIEDVVDDGGSSQGQFSNQSGGRYATRVVLRYNDVKPDTAAIYQAGAIVYSPDVTPIGAEAQFTLEVVPQGESIPVVSHLQSAIAFGQMVGMISYPRHLCYPQDFTNCPLTSLISKRGSQIKGAMNQHSVIAADGLPFTSSSAKDCHAPLMLICKTNTCNLVLQ